MLDFPEKPEYFETEIKVPTAMTYGELKEYSQEVRDSGQVAPELEVELGKKLSYPAVSLIMALVALPFSFRLGRRGALYGVGVAIVVGMIFCGLLALFTTLGETGALPPTIAVWTPNVLFAPAGPLPVSRRAQLAAARADHPSFTLERTSDHLLSLPAGLRRSAACRPFSGFPRTTWGAATSR